MSPLQAKRTGALLPISRAEKLAAIGLLVSAVLVFNASARATRQASVPWLCSNAAAVVVAEVESIKSSGIETTFSYPTFSQATFHWLHVRMKVLGHLKGPATTNHIDVAMLAVLKGEAIINSPLMLYPKNGQKYIMFLAPSSKEGMWVSFFAPYDEENAMFLLDRQAQLYDMSGVSTNPAFKDYRDERQEERDMVWSMVDANGKIQTKGIEKFRARYRRELEVTATPKPIPLQWEKYTNPGGWSFDVPKGSQPTNR